MSLTSILVCEADSELRQPVASALGEGLGVGGVAVTVLLLCSLAVSISGDCCIFSGSDKVSYRDNAQAPR